MCVSVSVTEKKTERNLGFLLFTRQAHRKESDNLSPEAGSRVSRHNTISFLLLLMVDVNLMRGSLM